MLFFVLLIIRFGNNSCNRSIRVLNNTSEEYWFLMNFNFSHLSGNVDIRGVKIMAAYFLVRLRINSRSLFLF